MTVNNLGRLERVDLRNIWLSEASDFTPWLARKENLDILGETLRIDLELEAQERPVGPFRADILCKDTETDRWVLIENQLERTDHVHLGQLPMPRDWRRLRLFGSPHDLPKSIARLLTGSIGLPMKAFVSSDLKSNCGGSVSRRLLQNSTSFASL